MKLLYWPWLLLYHFLSEEYIHVCSCESILFLQSFGKWFCVFTNTSTPSKSGLLFCCCCIILYENTVFSFLLLVFFFYLILMFLIDFLNCTSALAVPLLQLSFFTFPKKYIYVSESNSAGLFSQQCSCLHLFNPK